MCGWMQARDSSGWRDMTTIATASSERRRHANAAAWITTAGAPNPSGCRRSSHTSTSQKTPTPAPSSASKSRRLSLRMQRRYTATRLPSSTCGSSRESTLWSTANRLGRRRRRRRASVLSSYGNRNRRTRTMKDFYKLLGALFAADVVLFALSGVFQDAHGFTGALGAIGWFGFLLMTLVLVILAITSLVRRGLLARRAA